MLPAEQLECAQRHGGSRRRREAALHCRVRRRPAELYGPSLAAQAFPEALLRWQEGGEGGEESRVRTVSSIWSWTCAAKRASMYCIWPYQEQGKRVEEEGASAHMRERLVRVARRVGQY